jgi:hypothetical protein
MTWVEIRAHYAALHAQARAAGATQKAIAERGGIAGQNTVSSQFFVELEQGAAGTPEPPAAPTASVIDRLNRIERALESLGVSVSSSAAASSQLASSSLGAPAPPGTQEGRPSHGCSALSPAVINHNHIATPDLWQFEAKVDARIESVQTALGRLDARVARLGHRDGNVPSKKPTARGTHRRREAAKPA